eukprot:gnl/MRDRNA2_/MRDRNA2_68350_c0_seq2.p1 gnl/MRDRNA2_/MRDRNA2_68350_c0~~gnl/MRDRNA2_/MRDRNA2_68350_c0_seq2.p1  ORF type:complete len:138 (-),score=20.26 gnl/MRDRNA2_/MRDRNA2_68350_c0_seq2:196-609(-)
MPLQSLFTSADIFATRNITWKITTTIFGVLNALVFVKEVLILEGTVINESAAREITSERSTASAAVENSLMLLKIARHSEHTFASRSIACKASITQLGMQEALMKIQVSLQEECLIANAAATRSITPKLARTICTMF